MRPHLRSCAIYCEAVGALDCAAFATHPDIVFAVATVSTGQVLAMAHWNLHWNAVKRIYISLARGLPTASRAECGQVQRADGSTSKDCHAITGYA